MSRPTEGAGFVGHIIIEEIQPGFAHFTRHNLPAQDLLVSREEGHNIVCHTVCDAMTDQLGGLTSLVLPPFNYMAISTNTAPVSRSTNTIPGIYPVSKFISPGIFSVVNNTPPTSLITWVHTFPAVPGRPLVAKFGMENNRFGIGNCLNEYLFDEPKDNSNFDLKITYTLSIGP